MRMRFHGAGPTRSAGFTIVELLITITLAAILAAIGIPSYRSITNSSRIAGEVNGMLGDLLLARSEAIKQGLPVTMCIAANSSYSSCATSGLTWQNGWIVFVDLDNDQTVDSGETPMKIQAVFNGTDTFVSNNTRAITFNREGFASLMPGANSTTLITLHAATATTASTRCLSLIQLGRVVVQKAGTGSCS